MKMRFNLDALGVCASTLCMVHCLAFPLLLAVLPLWSASTQTQETEACCVEAEANSGAENAENCVAACCSTPTDFWVHVGLASTVAPLGLIAWGAGYRKHRRWGVLALGLAGVLLLAGALLFGSQLLGGRGEQIMTVSGSVCMVSAHLWNRRQCRCCRSPDASRLVETEAVIPLPTGGAS